MNMKSIFKSLLLVAFLACPVALNAGDDDSDGFGARFSAEADYRISRGFHLSVSEEIRLGGRNIMDRSHTQLGISYKINDYLKVGGAYTAIAAYKDDVTILEDNSTMTRYWYDWRHRVSGYVMGSFKAGQWKFSLRERIQGTYRTRELNNLQDPQMEWVLRSRLKVAYKCRTVPLEPYAYFEPRLVLNGAKWSEESVTPEFENAVFLGHKDVYFNRLRGAVGVEWRLARRHSLDFYCLYDRLRDKEIDARKEGSEKGETLKAQTFFVTGNRVSVGVGYKFSF